MLISGLQKLGIAVAFINFHIKGQPLIHTIKACEAKVLIIGSGTFIVVISNVCLVAMIKLKKVFYCYFCIWTYSYLILSVVC